MLVAPDFFQLRALGVDFRRDFPATLPPGLLHRDPLRAPDCADHQVVPKAGFYVKGVRLNATWALKLLYLFGVLIFSLFTQAVLKAQ